MALGRPGRREPASYPPNTPLCSFQCHMTPTARAPPRPRHSRLPPGPAAPRPVITMSPAACQHEPPADQKQAHAPRKPSRTQRRATPPANFGW